MADVDDNTAEEPSASVLRTDPMSVPPPVAHARDTQRVTRLAFMEQMEWAEPPAGTRFGENYEAVSRLGRGAMGVVMLATDLALDRLVAVKFIRPRLLVDDESHRRFAVEAKVMAKVRHPHVAAIHAFGDYNGAPYFAMEYVQGPNLRRWLRKKGPLSLDEALGVLDPICRGVQAIHDAGAVHGDLKPANVLMGEPSRVVVTDFGSARTTNRRGKVERVHGTPAYLAPELGMRPKAPPEQAARADVYSLGVMAYQLLTGSLPFVHDEVLAMLRAHARDEPPIPSEAAPELPAAFDAVLLGALHKDPALRIPSARALRIQLLQARQTVTTAASSHRFVVADDEAVARLLGRTTLEGAFEGAKVVEVGTGTDALAAIRAEPTSAALIDLSMPGLTGLELVDALRREPRTAQVPVVVITGSGGAEDWRRLSAMGVAGFLVKPIDPASLVALVRRVVSADDDV